MRTMAETVLGVLILIFLLSSGTASEDDEDVPWNEYHLQTLLQGVDYWNGWRDENPEEFPELSSVNLTEARLSLVNLQEGDMA
ncbi:MAG TPA: hypothetical protein PLS83_12485, partial [Methanothrix soehngenii]|nr:hypothetical protein [Methanothrix soehngenii]